jgi:alpha-beta hydrolase superfamily lysophospholipase
MEHSERTFEGFEKLSLYYQSWQPEGETKAALAIVHGFGEHSGRYMNIVEKLVPMGFAVYGFDHRGHGKSPGQRGHIMHWKEFTEDLHNFLDLVRKEQKEKPLFLMGHSLGGLIVLNYVIANPEGLKGVIASGPLLSQPGISPVLLLLGKIMSKIWPGFSIDTKLDVTTISRDPEVQKAYEQDPLVHSLGTARLSTEISAATEWTQAHASKINLPLLIVHGGADTLVEPEGSAEFFDKVTFADKERIVYPEGRHESHNDIDKEKVLQDISSWLEKHIS